MIAGIGLNVNSNPAVYPEIYDTATSLRKIFRQDFPRLQLLKVVLDLIETHYQQLQAGDYPSLKNKWDALSLITNKSVSVKSMGTAFEGIAESVDEDGVLTLRDHTGTRWRIVCADVSLSLL